MTVLELPRTIRTDGSQDVGAALTEYGAGVAQRDVVVIPPGSQLRADRPVDWSTLWNVNVQARGSLLYSTTRPEQRTRPNLVLGGGGCTIADLTVDGRNPRGGDWTDKTAGEVEASHAIVVAGAQGLTLQNVHGLNAWADGLAVRRVDVPDAARAADPLAGWTRNLHTIGCHFDKPGRQAVSGTGAFCTLMEGGYVGHAARSNVDLEPLSRPAGTLSPTDPGVDGHNGILGWTMSAVRFGPGRLGAFTAAGSGQVDRVALLDCPFDRTMRIVAGDAYGRIRHGFEIRRCSSSTPDGRSTGASIEISGYTGAAFTDCSLVVEADPPMVGALFARCTKPVYGRNVVVDEHGARRPQARIV